MNAANSESPPPDESTPPDAGAESISGSLLMRVRSHDDEAWQRMCYLYGPVIEAWCRAKGVRGEDAGDVRQEVLLAVAEGIGKFRRDRPGDTFRGWLYGITHFKVLDFHRQRAKHPEAVGGAEAQGWLSQLPASVSEEMTREAEQTDAGGVFRRALSLVRVEFSDQTWQAFWKTTVEQRLPADVAADLGMKPGAVYVAKSRVLKRLREELSELEEIK